MDLFRKIKFIIFIYINFINCVQSENDLFVALLINPEQQKLLKDFNNIFTRIGIKNDVIIANELDTNSTVTSLCRNFENGISVIVDITFTPMPNLLNIINIAQTPYLKLDITIGPFMKIAEDYLINRTATDAVFIFQRDEDIDEALYHMLMEPTLLRLAFMNGLSYDFVERLKNLRPTPSYYVLFATTSNMDVILNRIAASRSFVRPDKWHLMFLDYNSKNFNNEKLVEFATKISPSQDSRCKLKYSDSCRISEKFSFPSMLFKEVLTVLNELDKNQKTPKTWDCHNDFNETSLQDTSTELNSLATIFKNNPIFSIKNGQVKPNLNMTIETFSTSRETYNGIAIWEQGILKPFQRKILPARRFFRIGTTEALPWSVIRRDPVTHETILDNNGNPLWEGYCIDMIAKLSEKLSFDYEIVPPTTGTFGKRLQNGKWDGLVGDLVMGKTDLSIAALKMTSEREEVIDFIAPYFEQTGISIVIRKAVRQTSLFKFMTVLRLEVWLSIVAALVATAILIWLLDKYSPYSARNNKKAYPYPCREFTLKESFWFALTSFTPQGGGETPKAISGRTLVAAYWLFVVLMLATFTANLAAFLSVERMQTPVQSLEQLARQSRINYTVVEGSDTHKYFINMKFAEDTLYRLWKELVLNATSDQTQYRIWDYPIKEQYGHILLAINSSNPVKDAAEGFRKVNEHENADFAFIHDSAEIKYEISKNCNLTEVGEVFAEQPYAIAAQQGSNLQDELSYAILELQKDRFFEGLTAKYWNYSANKECFESEDNEGITLESLGGVFIATLFGLALSMITLFGEIIYYRRKNFKVQKVSPAELDAVTRIFKKKSDRNAGFGYPVTPPPPFDESEKDSNASEKPVTFGEQFVPARRHQMRVASIPVYSRKSIHEPIEYYE